MSERRTVKDLLADAKDHSELMVDLAHAAIFFGDDDIAAEVMRLLEGPEPPTILDVRASDAYARSPVRIPRSIHVALDSLGDGGSVPADAARVVVAYCT